jgi:glycosyltransferase involved in cell wall biosynthesis
MRIGLVSTLSTRVRPTGSGSVEGLVWVLARELTTLGHEVTVFAARGSDASGELVSILPSPYGAEGTPGDWQVCEWLNLCEAVAQSGRLDVLHSHSYLYGLPLQRLSRAPLVNTMHVMGGDEFARLWRSHPDACVTAISHAQWAAYPDLQPAAVVHHGLDEARFTFRAEPDDYVCYLGRFMSGKGPLLAIRAARELGVRLLLAGPANDYYHRRVAPLVDGHGVEYVGTVAGAGRDALLGGARALLYPLRDPEPFGLVLAEAMLCGTPVAAIAVGAVPEIVDEGITGRSARDAAGYVDAVRAALLLDRGMVRARAAARFSARRMAMQYAELYARVVAGRGGTRSTA